MTEEKSVEEFHKELVGIIISRNMPHMRYCMKVGSVIALGMTLTNPNLKCWECPHNMSVSKEGLCDPL